MANQFVIAYGSLIDPGSRSQQVQNASKAIPVRVEGFRQGWISAYPPRQVTFLGIEPMVNALTVGAFFPVTEDELRALDEREVIYQRVKVCQSAISLMVQGNLPEGDFWTYQSNDSVLPSSDCPIRQKYVDVVLRGCLSVGKRFDNEAGKKFARELINACYYWDTDWVDDRGESTFSSTASPISPAEKAAIDDILKKSGVLKYRR